MSGTATRRLQSWHDRSRSSRNSEEDDKKHMANLNGGLMYVFCCKCRTPIDSKPGKLNSISHGLCPECFKNEMDEMEAKYKKQNA
jgi:hypothetical protein